MLTQFFHWLADTVLALGYPGIVLLMAIESSVLPLPSELVMPPAGYLAAKGQMTGWVAVLAGTLGSLLGALINYGLAGGGRRAGASAVWQIRPGLGALARQNGSGSSGANGEISTFVGRLLPVIRHLISIPAGMSRMALGRFALLPRWVPASGASS